jgi:hypothetical protein
VVWRLKTSRRAISHLLAETLVEWGDLPSRRAATTTLLLVSAPDLDYRCAEVLIALDRAHLHVDAPLVKRLYAAAPARLKIAIASAPVMPWLDARTFGLGLVFRDAWSRHESSSEEEADLASTLQAFVRRHPDQASSYRDLISKLLASANDDSRWSGAMLVGFLSDMEESDMKRMTALLEGTRRDRSEVLGAITRLYERLAALAPRLQAYLTSTGMRRRLREVQRSDADSGVREDAARALARV